jgi:hypothetical protein
MQLRLLKFELASGAYMQRAKMLLRSVSGVFALCQRSLTLTANPVFFRIIVVFA